MASKDLFDAIARSNRDAANRGKHIHQKGWVTLDQMRKNAAEMRSAFAIVLLLLIVILYVLGLLVRGLFSKNMFVRIFSALGLLALIIGTTVLVRNFMGDHVPTTSEEEGFKSKSQSNQIVRTTGESKGTNTTSHSQLSPSKGRSSAVPEKTVGVLPHEEAKVEYICRFCGLHSFTKDKDGQVICKQAPQLEGKVIRHDFIPSCEYVEPVKKMCIKCGYKTRFPEVFSSEHCKFGPEHEFYKTLITEPKLQDCDLHKNSSHVCVYCGHFTSYPEIFKKEDCNGCRPWPTQGKHRFLTKEKYVSLAVVQCEKCGISTRIPELRADEECAKGGLHKFLGESGRSSNESLSAQMTSEIKSKEVEEYSGLPQVVSHHLPVRGFQPQGKTSQEKNPHFEASRLHDWQPKCQKEWGKSFLEIQRTFSVFGGFQLAQPPIDGIKFGTRGDHDSGNIQKDVPLLKQYRYFQKADLEFFNGALVGFTLKAHFPKTYSKASIDRECRAFQDDVVKNLQRLKRADLGIGLDSTFPYHPWSLSYGESPSPSIHKIVGMIITSYDLRQTDDGYDLTLSVDAIRGLRQFIELVLKQGADEMGDELPVFDAKQNVNVEDPSSRPPAVPPNKVVRITGYGSYKFGQKYSATRMTAEMRQEGRLAIKPVSVHYRKFQTLELGYAINGKQLCQLRFCAEFPSDTNDGLLDAEVSKMKNELERQFGFEMTESRHAISYEDDNYVVKVWYQNTAKTVYKTTHAGFRKQRMASTVNIKGLYMQLEDKRLMPKY